MKQLFTAQELAELAAYDAEIDKMQLVAQDYRDSAQRDKDAVFAEKGTDARRKARKLAAYQREYREANKEQIAAYQREYWEANKEQLAAKKREYWEANPGKYEKHKAYMSEYMRRRRAAQKGACT